MSLINDALKKAREAQLSAPAPPASEPHFRPADPEQPARYGLGIAVPVALCLVALGSLALVWRVSRQPSGDQVPRVEAKTPATPAAADAAPPAQLPATAQAAMPADQLVAKAEHNSTAPATNVAGISAPIAGVTAVATVTPATNTAPGAVVPARPPPKLQGIVFNPRRPSALIDGKTLFVGDRLGAFRVAAISHDTVTLAGTGVTNVLSLSD